MDDITDTGPSIPPWQQLSNNSSFHRYESYCLLSLLTNKYLSYFDGWRINKNCFSEGSAPDIFLIIFESVCMWVSLWGFVFATHRLMSQWQRPCGLRDKSMLGMLCLSIDLSLSDYFVLYFLLQSPQKHKREGSCQSLITWCTDSPSVIVSDKAVFPTTSHSFISQLKAFPHTHSREAPDH